MKNIFKHILICGVLVGSIASCSSGNAGNDTNSLEPDDGIAPVGPFSYTNMEEALYTMRIIKPSNSSKSDAEGSDCGSAYSYTNEGIGIATKITNFIPVVGSALGEVFGFLSTLLSFLGGNDSNICLANQLFDINQQLAQQQQQINNIKNVLSGLQTEFYNTSYMLASQTLNNQVTSYNSQLQYISGSNTNNIMTYGMFGNFMLDVGLWSNYGKPNSDVTSINDIVNSATMNTASTFVLGQQTAFQLGISQISGSGYNVSACYSGNCYQNVGKTNSALNATYASIYTAFRTEVTGFLNNGQDVIPLFDDYNNTLIAFYLQSANALQQGYSLENIINQMNFYAGTKGVGGGLTIPSLGGVPGTYFSWDSTLSLESNAAKFNEVQSQLALMYLARFNQLYINTIAYIVTDKIVGAQTWPAESATLIIDNIKLIEAPYNYESALGIAVQTPIQIFGLGGAVKSNTMIYQFKGLMNTAQCANTVAYANSRTSVTHEAADYFTDTTCTSIFARPIPGESSGAYNQTIWTESTLIPYYVADLNTLPIWSDSIYGVLSACTYPQQNLYWYHPNNQKQTFGTVNGNYLMCSLWNTGAVTDFNSTNSPLQQGDNYYYLWSGGYNASVFYYSWYHWATFNVITPKNLQNSSFISPVSLQTIASDHDGAYFGIGNWNSNMSTLGNITYPQQNIDPNLPILAGNMPNGYAGTSLYGHQLAMQAVMPDGFILPYVLVFYNVNGEPGNRGAVAYNQNLNNVYYLNDKGESAPLVQSLPMNSSINPVAMINKIVFSVNLRMIGGSNYTNTAGCNCFSWYYGFISESDYNPQSFIN